MDHVRRKDKESPSSHAFPTRLFAMLEESQKRGFEDVIAWQPGGESFRVFKPDRFAAEIAGDFFALRKYKSFLRQLNIYGCVYAVVGSWILWHVRILSERSFAISRFQRIHHGPNKGGYCHSLFKRSEADACKLISRQGESQRAPAVADVGIANSRVSNVRISP